MLNDGKGVGIVLYSPLGKIHNFFCRLEIACTNNFAEFEALILSIENSFNLGCKRLMVFGDSELVVNFIKKIYKPLNKLLKQYTQAVWQLIFNLLSFNISYVHKELNSMADGLVIYASHPKRKLLSKKLDCAYLSLYCPHIPANEESWKIFPDDESIYVFLKNEPLNKNEIISLYHNKFPKGLTPLEGSFSSNDVNSYKNTEPKDSRRNIGDTILVNIGTKEDSKFLKIGA